MLFDRDDTSSEPEEPIDRPTSGRGISLFPRADDVAADQERGGPRFGRDGVQLFLPYWLVFGLVSIGVHILLLLGALFLPQWFPVHGLAPAELEQQMAEQRARQAEQQRFVFVQPRAEFEARRPTAPPQMSDRDRSAQSLERAPNPTNMMPFSRGNTPEMVDEPGSRAQVQPDAPAAPAPSAPDAAAERGQPGPPNSPPADAPPPFLRPNGPGPRASETPGTGGGGRLGDAVRNVQRYAGAEQLFDNPQGGGGQFGSAIQFDTKGVEFGPWLRRFIAQIKRNWNVPYAAMSLRGHVVVTFNVHKDGRITDVTVVGPSGVDGFNNSSFNAISASNPTQPLPPEYPADKAFFTVTFFYNETPPR